MDKEFVAGEFMSIQDKICSDLERLDEGKRFREDLWLRQGGGGGRSRILEEGRIFEKGGVNFSKVFGSLPEFLRTENNPDQVQDFFATGVSIVLHPVNPMVPIIHMNVRYFERGEKDSWFGGGIDLTPHYVDETDAIFFHQSLKEICDRHSPGYYDRFKKEADDYFFIPHRNETRGIGGIFFDHLRPVDSDSGKALFSFVRDLAEGFVPMYKELVTRNAGKAFTEKEKQWQLIRRGRYVEFNLVYDRGTKFGLETGGRTESVLMSLPPHADWKYNMIPEDGTAEARTLSYLKKGINWLERRR